MSAKIRKIGIIGAGHVGSHIALLAAEEALADEIVLYDICRSKAKAQVMDLQDTLSYFRINPKIYEGTVSDMHDADIMILAAGNPRLPGQNRLDKMEASIATYKNIIPQIKQSGFDGFIISITNPCDIIAAYVQKKLDWPIGQMIGSGTALDSARLNNDLALQLHVAPHSVTAYVLGEHGDSSMIPWSHIFIGGIPIKIWMEENLVTYSREWKNTVSDYVHKRASLEVQGKGCTEFGIAASVCEIVRAIFHNEHKILPCSVYWKEMYGIQEGFASVPVQLGVKGIEKIIEFQMTAEEQKQFAKSIHVLHEYFERGILL